jgi:hypothetical protein
MLPVLSVTNHMIREGQLLFLERVSSGTGAPVPCTATEDQPHVQLAQARMEVAFLRFMSA